MPWRMKCRYLISLESGSQYSEWKTNLCSRYSMNDHSNPPKKKKMTDIPKLKFCHDSMRYKRQLKRMMGRKMMWNHFM